MGWEDRDYARPAGSRSIFRSAGGGIPLVSGSIVTTLIVVNTAIFLLEWLIPAVGAYVSGGVLRQGGQLVPVSGLFQMRPDFVQQGQLWRLITAQYLHNDWMHLLFNMVGLHFLGRMLEQNWSVRRFMFVYTLCGMFGYIFYTFIVEPTRSAVGASGSIYGLLGIVAVMSPAETLYIYLFPIRIRTAAIIFGLISFFSIQARTQNFGGEACHLAGLVFGVWWALRGDEWWSRTEWRFLPHSRSKSARAPIKFPSEFAGTPEPPRNDDQQTVDRILAKIGLQGMDSLSPEERTLLRDATERLKGGRR